jgi:hypothetical protein
MLRDDYGRNKHTDTVVTVYTDEIFIADGIGGTGCWQEGLQSCIVHKGYSEVNEV